MKKVLENLKFGDLLLIGLLVLISFIPVAVFASENSFDGSGEFIAVITQDGEVLQEFVLSDDGESEEYIYQNELGHFNHIVRKGTEITMIDSNCPDRICLTQGPISRPGQTIICLPYKVMIEVVAGNGVSGADLPIDAVS